MTEVSPEIIEQCSNGDIGALGAIYQVFGDRVYRLSLRLLGSEADAEDATQQIFLRVFDQIGKFDGRSSLATWLYRVATNHCLNLLSRQRRTLSLSDQNGHAAFVATIPAPARQGTDPDDDRLLTTLLDTLDPDDRSLILLKEVAGLTYRELACVLDVPPGTVMSRLHRARGRLLSSLSVLESNSGMRRRDLTVGLSKPAEERSRHDL